MNTFEYTIYPVGAGKAVKWSRRGRGSDAQGHVHGTRDVARWLVRRGRALASGWPAPTGQRRDRRRDMAWPRPDLNKSTAAR